MQTRNTDYDTTDDFKGSQLTSQKIKRTKEERK